MFFNRINKPICIKEGTSIDKQINDLREILNKVSSKDKLTIEEQIKKLEKGLFGEKKSKIRT